jgi:hypothetical protein
VCARVLSCVAAAVRRSGDTQLRGPLLVSALELLQRQTTAKLLLLLLLLLVCTAALPVLLTQQRC